MMPRRSRPPQPLTAAESALHRHPLPLEVAMGQVIGLPLWRRPPPGFTTTDHRNYGPPSNDLSKGEVLNSLPSRTVESNAHARWRLLNLRLTSDGWWGPLIGGPP